MKLTDRAKSGVWLTVDFFIKPEHTEAAEKLFAQHVEDGRNDRGNLFFSMMRRKENPAHFFSLECWESMADIENHDAQPHHPVFLAQLAKIQAKEKEVVFMDWFKEGLLR